MDYQDIITIEPGKRSGKPSLRFTHRRSRTMPEAEGSALKSWIEDAGVVDA